MSERGMRRTRTGVVISDKMDKTIVVAVERRVRHPLYGRTMRVTNKFKAHDEQNQCQAGDRVRVMESRPISKDKHWVVTDILEKAK